MPSVQAPLYCSWLYVPCRQIPQSEAAIRERDGLVATV